MGARGLANNLAKKLEEDKARKARLGGFGIHSMVKGEHHNTFDKALGKFEKKTKVQPVRGTEKHDFSTAGRAINWSSKGGNKLSMAAGKALVETKKVVTAPPPPPGSKNRKHKDNHSSNSDTGSDDSGSSYDTSGSDSDSDTGSSSGSDSS
eukprot:g8736.t1